MGGVCHCLEKWGSGRAVKVIMISNSGYRSAGHQFFWSMTLCKGVIPTLQMRKLRRKRGNLPSFTQLVCTQTPWTLFYFVQDLPRTIFKSFWKWVDCLRPHSCNLVPALHYKVADSWPITQTLCCELHVHCSLIYACWARQAGAQRSESGLLKITCLGSGRARICTKTIPFQSRLTSRFDHKRRHESNFLG